LLQGDGIRGQAFWNRFHGRHYTIECLLTYCFVNDNTATL